LQELTGRRARSQGIHLLHFALFTSGRTYRRVLLFAVTEAIAVGLWNQLKAMARNGTELDGSKGLVRCVHLSSSAPLARNELTLAPARSYAFDILYVTWFVHVATALVSAQFWKLYWVVRLSLSLSLLPSATSHSTAAR